MATDHSTVTIERLDGGSTTFLIPRVIGKRVTAQTFVLDVPMPRQEAEGKLLELRIIGRPPLKKEKTYVDGVLSGAIRDTREIEPRNGMRRFERDLKGVGIMILYVFSGTDGNLVLVEDSGKYNLAYHFYHEVPARYSLEFVVSKEVGGDFKFVDEQAMNFVNSLITEE